MTIAAVVVGFLGTAFAMNQGEFHSSTRWGIFSLVLAVLLLALLFWSGVNLTHVQLPAAS